MVKTPRRATDDDIAESGFNIVDAEPTDTRQSADNVTDTDGIASVCCPKTIRKLADLVLTTDEQKTAYLQSYNCNPPPLFILLLSLSELVVFVYYEVKAHKHNWLTMDTGLVRSPLIYDPWNREDAWRFVSYMFLHADIEHILGNVILQLVFGIMLEMVHKSARVLIVFMSGVLAGSLASSIFDPFIYLVGASGGVYALLGGYLMNVILSWSKMAFNVLHLLVVLVIVITDLGFSLYRRLVYDSADYAPVSLTAHFAGGLAGITVGYIVFSNYNKDLISDPKWWVCLMAYAFCCGFAVFWNLFLSPVGTIL